MSWRRLKQSIKLIAEKESRVDQDERQRLARLPRYAPTTTRLLGRQIQIVDACTYLAGVAEIFDHRIYEFSAPTDEPAIIDAGANIGLSVLYFKHLYPKSRITAFEPDPVIFAALQKNVQAFGHANVALLNKAVWRCETTLKFWQEGGYSGRIAGEADADNLIETPTVRLKDFLQQEVDFLKLDIEGAETEVLRDCADDLGRVGSLFVEYHSSARQSQTLHELLTILHNAGFRYHIKEAYVSPAPFKERPTMMGMDLQLNIFAFRA